MSRSILVTGGTGKLGREVLARLTDSADVRVLSRRSQSGGHHAWAVGDLRSGEGLDAAVTGVSTIVHCATAPRGDLDATRNLIAAARHAGQSPHLLYISIVGVDRVPLGYYRTKLAAEALIESSGLPWTILRATQFHNLIVGICTAQRRLPVLLVPSATFFQPIDVGDVADRLVELAAGAPAGRVDDIGGPEIRTMASLATAYLRSSGRRRRIVAVRVPGRIGRGYRNGAHLAAEHAVGQVRFEQFLATSAR